MTVKERNTLPWQRHFSGTVQYYFKDAVQFRTLVLAVEIDEPTTKKVRECGAKETQLSLMLVIIASCLIFPINISEFFLYEKLIEMWGDYVLICKENESLITLHINT